MKTALLFLLATLSVAAQTTTHSVTLSWTASSTPGVSYNVYRAPGPCTGAPVFAKLASSGTLVTYTDLAVTASTTYCYQVKAALAGTESVPSNSAVAAVPATIPGPPSNLGVVIVQVSVSVPGLNTTQVATVGAK